MTHRTLWYVSAVALGLSAATTVQAQQVGEQFRRDHNVSVRDRPRPELEQLGIKAGGFTVRPSATASLTHDDNIYATDGNETGDLIGELIGALSAKSDWSRHSLAAGATVTHDAYQDNSSEDSTTYALTGGGRIDITRDAAVIGDVLLRHDAESRTASGVSADTLAKPVRYDTAGFNLGAARAFNRLRLSASYNYRDYDYKDGVDKTGASIDQDYRDRKTETGTVRVDYAISPNTAIFVQAAGNRREYDQKPPVVTIDRDSTGTEFTIGADIDLKGLVRGKAQVGHISQDFKAASSPDISGFGADAQIEWFPTQLTTLTFRGSREIQDTGLIQSPAALASSGGLQVDHELLRNLLLTARLDYSKSDYELIDRTDKRTSANFGVNYLMNRHFNLQLFYSYLDQKSEGADLGVNYTVNQISATIVAKY